MIFWIILPFLFLQLSNAIKFTELKGNDLKGNKEVSFAKYENKCVLLLQLSPLIRSPPARVEELNKIYDKYNGQGLDIVAISSRSAERTNKIFEDLNPKFDIYTSEFKKETLEFLRQNKFQLNDKFLIQKDSETCDRFYFRGFIADKRNVQVAKSLDQKIQECLNIQQSTTESQESSVTPTQKETSTESNSETTESQNQ